MSKRILSMVLGVTMIIMMGTTTFAAEQEIPIPNAATNEVLNNESGEANAVLSTLMRGTSLPSSSFDLSKNNYNADLQIVGKSWLYTNRYYYPNGDGKINVSYDVISDSSTTSLYIGLYDLTKNEMVVEFDAIEVRTTGKTSSMYFYNLIQSHKYAVCFRADPSSLNGSATIKH